MVGAASISEAVQAAVEGRASSLSSACARRRIYTPGVVARILLGLGLTLLVAGLMMVPLPGPGWLIVGVAVPILAVGGLAVMSSRI